jgi:copper chaperone CopZ
MMTVTSVLNKLEGATLKNISPGAAEIELTGTTRSAVVEAIEKAGYNVTNK